MMDFDTRFRLLVGMVERHEKAMPRDYPESARIPWLLQPVRDILKDLEAEISALRGSDSEGYDS